MYIVIEIQTTDSVATLVDTYAHRKEAESKYHSILTSAAVSNVTLHGAVMLTNDGVLVKSECYDKSEDDE